MTPPITMLTIMTALTGLLKTLRPRQWVKNLLVFLPLLFAVDLAWTPDDLTALGPHLLRLTALSAAFCAAAAAIYLVNDLSDRDADRRHPVKRRRPIASGDLPAPLAWTAALLLAAVGMAGFAWLGWQLAVIAAIYLAMNLGYSFGLKQLPPVDVLLVAGGYVLRTAAGAIAVGVAPSPWLYAVTAAGALFLVMGRRYAEFRLTPDGTPARDAIRQRYGAPLGGQLLTLSATIALVSYTLYTVEADNLPANDTMLLTVPPVLFGLFRYLYLLHYSPDAESPELLVTRDIPLLLSIAAWLGVTGAVLVLN